MKKTTGLGVSAFLIWAMLMTPLMAVHAGMDFNMMLGNDNITFGLADNNDDGVSFGVKADLGIGRHTVSAALSGVTVKGYRTERGDVVGRYDSFDLGYSHLFEWRFGDGERTRITLEPYVGMDLVGNMGMEWVQNTWHGVMGKETVSLPYDDEGVVFHPAVGLSFAWLRDVSDDLTLGIGDSFSYGLHWGLRNETVVTLRSGDRFRIGLGWSVAQNLTGRNDVHEVQAIRNSGFILSSVIHAGIFSFEFRSNLTHGLSYGLIGFNPLAFMDMETFDDTGHSVMIGAEWGWPGYMHRLILSRGNWQLRVKYVGGETVIGSEMRVNDASFSAGYDFLWDFGHFSPFVAPWGGIAQYIYYRPDRETNVPFRMVEAYRPVIGVDAGVRMIRKGALKLGGAACAVDVGASLSWNIGASTVSRDSYPEYRERISPFEARAFIDLVFYI